MPSMMPALSPKRAEMVPKVKPVLISSVEKAARRGAAGERIDDAELGKHLGREQQAEESEVGRRRLRAKR